jgi:hypothetical protein
VAIGTELVVIWRGARIVIVTATVRFDDNAFGALTVTVPEYVPGPNPAGLAASATLVLRLTFGVMLHVSEA